MDKVISILKVVWRLVEKFVNIISLAILYISQEETECRKEGPEMTDEEAIEKNAEAEEFSGE